MRLLSDNQICVSQSNTEYPINGYLGGGTQGEVYKSVKDSKTYAIKWYFLQFATKDQRRILENLIEVGSPSKAFLWPIEIVTIKDKKGFGYVMPYRDSSYKGIVDLMRCKVEPSFSALVTAGNHLADSYKLLHGKGMCYRDINFGNVFFHPQTGETLICDNDNVTFVSDEHKVSVMGTPKFMAPELVVEEAMPSDDTDRFSLAVLLFYMFMVSHPLDGRNEAKIHCMDPPANKKLYGTNPIFIFNETDRSNEPDPTYHSNALVFWPLYPKFFRDLFTKSFTEGLFTPTSRVRETEWVKATERLKDSIMICQNCSAENFYCPDKNLDGHKCWRCSSSLKKPPQLITDEGRVLLLSEGAKVYLHHVDTDKSADEPEVIGIVNTHPNNKSVIGLKNLTNTTWRYIDLQGETKEVQPSRSIKLIAGIQINFGKSFIPITA